ncbi:MAG TPA: tyrosine-type recombinase/integrase [Pseudolabrys sp.]
MASIRKRVLPSKKIVWQVDYRDTQGKRRHKQFAKRKAADKWSVKARADVAGGTHVPDAISITAGDAGDFWIKRCELAKLEPTTIIAYKQHWDLHIKPFVGGKKLSQFTTADVEAFYETLLENGRSADMVRRVRISFGAALSYAQTKNLVVANVVKLTPFKVSKREKKRPPMPTIGEVRKLLATTVADWLAFLYVAIFAGLRASELRALPWRNVNFAKAMITVDQRADRWGKIGSPKSNAGTRDIPLPPIAMKALKEWKLRCPKGSLDLVFPTTTGTVKSHSNIMNRFFWPLQIEAGVTKTSQHESGAHDIKKPVKAKYGLHVLRHFCAAIWIEANYSAKKVQTLMGHASITQTYDTYGYLFERRERDQEISANIQKRVIG